MSGVALGVVLGFIGFCRANRSGVRAVAVVALVIAAGAAAIWLMLRFVGGCD
jgi:hypothetical protein